MLLLAAVLAAGLGLGLDRSGHLVATLAAGLGA